ncbi:MAG: polysaccharide deacetylase family protein [Flavobacteriales bacterium]|nr:polysaccharide deacetylase family protein [Flavobacteriales bacterium]
MLGWKAREEPDLKACQRSGRPFLIYGHAAAEGGFRIHPQGLLSGRGMDGLAAGPGQVGGAPPMPYPTPRKDPLFDPFAAAFWMLTRMEERDMPKDDHGRSLTAEMHAARHGFLDHPVVDEWVLDLAADWKQQDKRVPDPRRAYTQVVTLDLDNGYKYRGREWWRSLGSAVRDLFQGRLFELWDRALVLSGLRIDPYAVEGFLQQLCMERSCACMVSVLAAPRGRHDHAVDVASPAMRARVKAMAAWARIAVHPSYRSSEVPGMIEGEKQLLEQVLGSAVTCSRQHFLRFQAPTTFRELIRLGIREEHSMGFHDAVGFRAGTCTPFPFFDVEHDEVTPLMIHPFAIMDSALRYRMSLQPEDAIRRANALVDAVKRVQGTFISVWHERFLSDHGTERGWRRVAEEVIRHARS